MELDPACLESSEDTPDQYSQAMKNSNIVWDEKSLDEFIMAPQKALPGNAMPFPGIPDQKERNDLIAYLEMLK
jgi:cytochrome c